MADPLAASVVSALIAGTSAAVSDGTRALLTKLAAVLRDRFRRKPSDVGVLEAAIAKPDDPVARKRLVALLEQHLRDDAEFAEALRRIWDESHAARPDEITNVVTGTVYGSVIQARDISGGITLHGPPQP